MKDFIKSSKIFGNIKMGAKSWDDKETLLGKDFLLKSKIIKVKCITVFIKDSKLFQGYL